MFIAEKFQRATCVKRSNSKEGVTVVATSNGRHQDAPVVHQQETAGPCCLDLYPRTPRFMSTSARGTTRIEKEATRYAAV